MEKQTVIGVNGDGVPADAIVDGKIAYAYVNWPNSNKRKCAGYATPQALAIVQFSNGAHNVTVEYFEPGEAIPDMLPAQKIL